MFSCSGYWLIIEIFIEYKNNKNSLELNWSNCLKFWLHAWDQLSETIHKGDYILEEQ